MSARSIWTGELRLGLFSASVKAYSAATESSRIKLTLVDPATCRPATQTWEAGGKPIARGQLGKAAEVGRDEFVLLQQHELDGLKPASSDVMTITGFVDAADIDPLFRGRAYYLAPKSTTHAEGYTVLAAVMRRTGKAALTRWFDRGSESPVVIEPRGRGLVATKLLPRAAVRSEAMIFETVGDQTPTKAMLALAEQLVRATPTKFEPDSFVDGYQVALAALIETKRGDVGQAGGPGERGKVINLMDALKLSLAEQPGAPKARAARSAAKPRSRKAG